MNIINKSILNELETHIPHDKFLHNLQTFMKYLPGQIVELDALLLTADMKAVSERAHTLKGTCGQFGAMRLHEIFKTIEICAEEERVEDLRSMVRVLPYEFQLVQELMSLSYMQTGQPPHSPRAQADRS